MKKKASLPLMELAIMILVFALAAVMCLRVFIWADKRSRYNEARSQMAICVQNAAEMLKYNRGDLTVSKNAIGGTEDGEKWTLRYDENYELTDGEAEYTIEVQREESEELLGQAGITALDKDGNELLTVTVCWQEVYNG